MTQLPHERARKTLASYRCCTQKEPGDPVIVRELHSDTDEMVFTMLPKITGKALEHLAFCEIHRRDPGTNNVSIVLQDNREFPKGKIIDYTGRTSMRLPSTADKDKTEDEIRDELNQFFENNKPVEKVEGKPHIRLALPAPDKLPNPHTIPFTRYKLKVA